MNLTDKFTYIYFALAQLAHVLGEGKDHIAAHGDLDVAAVPSSNCFYFLPISREEYIQYELLVLLDGDALHLLLGESPLSLLVNYC